MPRTNIMDLIVADAGSHSSTLKTRENQDPRPQTSCGRLYTTQTWHRIVSRHINKVIVVYLSFYNVEKEKGQKKILNTAHSLPHFSFPFSIRLILLSRLLLLLLPLIRIWILIISARRTIRVASPIRSCRPAILGLVSIRSVLTLVCHWLLRLRMLRGLHGLLLLLLVLLLHEISMVLLLIWLFAHLLIALICTKFLWLCSSRLLFLLLLLFRARW